MNRDIPPRSQGKGKITPDVKRQILDALWRGGTMETAAQTVDVSRVAIYKLLRRDPTFAKLVDEARFACDEVIESALYKAAKSGNVKAQVVWLTNRRPERWRNSHDVNLNASGEMTIRIEYVGGGTDGAD